LQGNGYTYGIKSEVATGYDFRDCGCYFVEEYGGFVDEIDEHKTRYIFLYEHPESIYGVA
jgi:hypothetical protein